MLLVLCGSFGKGDGESEWSKGGSSFPDSLFAVTRIWQESSGGRKLKTDVLKYEG